MPAVEEDIQFLIQIVKKDMEIKERKRLLGSIPPRIKAIERELRKMDEDLNETKQVFEKLEAEKRHIDQDLKTHQGEQAKKKEEQRLVKDNKTFRAVNAEIEYINKKIKNKEWLS